MGDQRDNIPKNVEQPIFENENARAENGEQARAWPVDFTTSLRENCSHLLQLVITRV